jgi:hypothetical protein
LYRYRGGRYRGDMKAERVLDAIMELSPNVRYAAVHHRDGEPVLRERAGVTGASSDVERWDELVVNPALLDLARRRGNLDADGLEFVLVRYGRFFNLILPFEHGHVSVVCEPGADPLPLIPAIRNALRLAS